MKKQEFIRIKFLGFELECKNVTKRGLIVITMTLIFLAIMMFFPFK